MSNKKSDVKERIGIVGYGEDVTGYILKLNGDRVYYYKVDPSNLSVLSEYSVRAKVEGLCAIGKALDHVEYIALDDRENYSANRKYLRQRRREEQNPQIRSLLLKEETFVKSIEADSSSARRFLLGFYVRKGHEKEAVSQLRNLQSLDKTLAVRIEPLTKEDIQEIIAMYFHQDTTTPSGDFEDFDGENYYKDVDFEELKDRLNKGAYSEPIISFDFNDSHLQDK